MKKLTITIALLVTLIPSISFASFDTNLKYGSKGDAVIELQDFLQDQGYLSGKIDGRFGLGTRKAVIAFQTANKLKGDGFFGAGSRLKARAMLESILAPSEKAEKEETGTISTIEPTITPTPVYVVTPTVITPPDTEAPRLFFQQMIQSWNNNIHLIKNENSLYGMIGLNMSIAEDKRNSSGLDKIEYYLDNQLLISREYYSNRGDTYGWDTEQYSDGTHTLTIKVWDKAGNMATDSAEIKIKNKDKTT